MSENKTQPHHTPRKNQHLVRRKRVVFWLVLLVFNLLLGGAYVGSIAWRCLQYSGKHTRWTGSAYEPHERFGWFPKSHQIAYHVLQHGERVPVLFNEDGFRIPVTDKHSSSWTHDKRILFLGCSFTHGYGLPAEKTFAYISSLELDADCLNAGGSGWGLAQMVLRARRDIPRVRPSWVIVQHSNWLVDRSMRFYGHTNLGKCSEPYVYHSSDSLRIHDPVFPSGKSKVAISEHAGKGTLAFTWHVGLPLFAYDDFHVLKTHIRSSLGLLPLPTSSRSSVIDFAYSEIFRLCNEHGARMLIVKVANTYSEHPYCDEMPNVGCPIVDTYPALLYSLPVSSKEAWQREYCFWRGSPPVVVDAHPNQKAHKVIAGVIVSAISEDANRD